jgi:hypothetical protein
MNIEEICNNYGLSSENELYQYMVESYFNGQKKQAKDIFQDLSAIKKYNYIENFSKNLDIWFNPEVSDNIKFFFRMKSK